EVWEFIYGVHITKGEQYSQASLKNALASINRHLHECKLDWKLNLLNKTDFPTINSTVDEILKKMKKLGIGAAKPYDRITDKELKLILNHNEMSPNNPTDLLHHVFLWICLLGCLQGGEHQTLLVEQFVDTDQGLLFKKFYQKNDQGGIEGNQHTFEILFPDDISNQITPNTDIKKYILMRLIKYKAKEFYLCVSKNESEQNISYHSGRDISIQLIFNTGNEEIKAMAISGHSSSS
ncbi:3031_t:CDS:2, partial [Acaulospora morrowiae]